LLKFLFTPADGVSLPHGSATIKWTEVVLEDKTAVEQTRLIAELYQKDKSVIFGLIEMMLTKKKFKDFFQKNMNAISKNPSLPSFKVKIS
jgi:hypothetical protein